MALQTTNLHVSDMVGPEAFRTFALDCLNWAVDADTSNRHLILGLGTNSRDIADFLEREVDDGQVLSDLRSKLN